MKFEFNHLEKSVLDSLSKKGRVYLVGGIVRDMVMYQKVDYHDVDVEIYDLEIDEIIDILSQYGKVNEVGKSFGILKLDCLPNFDFALPRIERKKGQTHREFEVEVHKNLDMKIACRRRDFTINAMAYNDEVGLVDPFNGMEDIEYNKIRCVGRPEDRFAEDALRILRAIRFASQLEFVIEPGTDWNISKMCKNLENISIERINSEFCKIAVSKEFCIQMVLYHDVFSLFIPEIKDMIGFKQNNPYHTYDVWNHTVYAVEYCESDDLVTRLAVFFHDFGKPHCYQDGEDGVRHFKGHGKVSADMTNEIMKRLRFDNDTREKVVELVYYHDATFEVGKKYVKRWLNKIGEEQFRRLLNVRRADIKAQADMNQETRLQKIDNIGYILDEVLQDDECFSLKDLAVNGKDLIAIGYKSGKEIGEVLNNLLDSVISGEYINEKEKLLEIAERRLYG